MIKVTFSRIGLKASGLWQAVAEADGLTTGEIDTDPNRAGERVVRRLQSIRSEQASIARWAAARASGDDHTANRSI